MIQWFLSYKYQPVCELRVAQLDLVEAGEKLVLAAFRGEGHQLLYHQVLEVLQGMLRKGEEEGEGEGEEGEGRGRGKGGGERGRGKGGGEGGGERGRGKGEGERGRGERGKGGGGADLYMIHPLIPTF